MYRTVAVTCVEYCVQRTAVAKARLCVRYIVNKILFVYEIRQYIYIYNLRKIAQIHFIR